MTGAYCGERGRGGSEGLPEAEVGKWKWVSGNGISILAGCATCEIFIKMYGTKPCSWPQSMQPTWTNAAKSIGYNIKCSNFNIKTN